MNKNILQQVNTLFKEDGLHDTFLNNIKIFKTTISTPRAPLLYDLCLVLVLQGKKIGFLGNETFEYNNKNYLVIPTTMPFECETHATKEEPFICALITIDKKIMYELIDNLGNKPLNKVKKCHLALFQDKVNENIEDITLRLLKTLESKNDSKILGNSLLRELYYRIINGENACFLHKMFLNTNNEAKIARSIRNIHEHYNTHLDIPSLAKEEEMSVSSFHTHFKQITSYTPLQYIKNLRLNKAKDLLAKQNFQVNDTAYAVGYESISQFSKDFKVYFGYPPKEAKASFIEYTLV